MDAVGVSSGPTGGSGGTMAVKPGRKNVEQLVPERGLEPSQDCCPAILTNDLGPGESPAVPKY